MMSSFLAGMQQQQMQMQQDMTNATTANNEAVAYHNQGDYDAAIACYEQALRYSPYNATIRENLAKTRHAKNLRDGEEAMKNWDDEKAARCFRDALAFEEDAEIRKKLAVVEERLKFNEGLRQRDDRLKEAKGRVDRMVGDLANKMDTVRDSVGNGSDGLDFMGKEEPPKVSPALADASLVVMDPGYSEVIDLSAFRPPERGLHVSDVPEPRLYDVPEWDPASAKTKAEIILDALKPGRTWDTSVADLDMYLRTKNPYNTKVREAVSYLEGMRDEAALMETAPKKGLFDAENSDSYALLPALAQRADGKTPPGTMNTLAESTERLKILNEWKSERTAIVVEALAKGGDFPKAITYLDGKIKNDPCNYAAADARAYLEGLNAYYEFGGQKKK